MPAVLLLKKSASATEVSLSRYTISETALMQLRIIVPDPRLSAPARVLSAAAANLNVRAGLKLVLAVGHHHFARLHALRDRRKISFS